LLTPLVFFQLLEKKLYEFFYRIQIDLFFFQINLGLNEAYSPPLSFIHMREYRVSRTKGASARLAAYGLERSN
jgi:hypothetical protein